MALRSLLSPSPKPDTTIAAYALGRLLALPTQAVERAARPAVGGGAPATPIQTLSGTVVKSGERKGRSTLLPIEQWLFKPHTSRIKLPFARLELPLDELSGPSCEELAAPEGLPAWLARPDLIPDAADAAGLDNTPIDERAVLLVFRDRSVLIGRSWRTAPDAVDGDGAVVGADVSTGPLVSPRAASRIQTRGNLLAIRLVPMILQLASSAATEDGRKQAIKVRGGTMPDLHAEIWIDREAVTASVVPERALEPWTSLSPAAAALMLRLADEVQNQLAAGEAMPTPIHPVEAIDSPDGKAGAEKTGTWPGFLTWSSWADADEGVLLERLAVVGDILTRQTGSTVVPRLHAGFLSEKDGIATPIPARIDAGAPELDAGAERLFFSGDWTPDRFTGWDVEWLGKRHGGFSFSSIEGRFLPHPKRIQPVRFPKEISGHAHLAAIRALTEAPCPARVIPTAGGRFPSLRPDWA